MAQHQNRQHNPKATVRISLAVWNLITNHTNLRSSGGNEYAQFSVDDARWFDLSALLITRVEYEEAVNEVERETPPGTTLTEGKKLYLAFVKLMNKGKIIRRRAATTDDKREVVFTKPFLDALTKATAENDSSLLGRFDKEGLVVETVSEPKKPTFHRVVGLGYDKNQQQVQGRIDIIREKRLNLSPRQMNRMVIGMGEDSKNNAPYYVVIAKHGAWLQCYQGEAVRFGINGPEITEPLPEVHYLVADTGMYQMLEPKDFNGKQTVVLIGHGPSDLTFDLVGGGKVVISKGLIRLDGVKHKGADVEIDPQAVALPEGEEAVEQFVDRDGSVLEPNPGTEPPKGTGDQGGEEGKGSAEGASAGANGTGSGTDAGKADSGSGSDDSTAKAEKVKKPRTRKGAKAADDLAKLDVHVELASGGTAKLA